MNKILVFVIIFLGSCLVFYKKPIEPQPGPFIQMPLPPQVPTPPPQPVLPNISVKMPPHLSYERVVSQLKLWQSEAPELAEAGTYGQTSKGTPLSYLRVTNKRTTGKPKVLITAAIHGNECLGTGNVMAIIGNLLSDYGRDERITRLLDERDIFFVPVLSPDSYPNSREVEGVDPNRNFPGPKNPDRKSVSPIAGIQALVLKERFQAAISGHCYGRVFLYPYGDTTEKTPNDSDYRRILGEMTRLCGYRIQQCCYNYGRPIFGTEVDWYYRHGVFAVVMEMGTQMGPPSYPQIEEEFNKTFQAVIYFIEEAPKIIPSRESARIWQ